MSLVRSKTTALSYNENTSRENLGSNPSKAIRRKKMKIRVCKSCGVLKPKLRKTGIGSMLQIKCLECGKDAGFVFKEEKKK